MAYELCPACEAPIYNLEEGLNVCESCGCRLLLEVGDIFGQDRLIAIDVDDDGSTKKL